MGHHFCFDFDCCFCFVDIAKVLVFVVGLVATTNGRNVLSRLWNILFSCMEQIGLVSQSDSGDSELTGNTPGSSVNCCFYCGRSIRTCFARLVTSFSSGEGQTAKWQEKVVRTIMQKRHDTEVCLFFVGS